MNVESTEYAIEFEELQNKNTFRGQQWFGERQRLVSKYSWAVPNVEALRYLSNFETLTEVGAGNGYWASCIEDTGIDVRATDIRPDEETHTEVEQVDARAMNLKDEVVLMVWPPHSGGRGMAHDVVTQRPSHVIYVGEPRGGCTAGDKFFDVIEQEYGLVATIEIPSYIGANDDLYHYTRKR